MPQAARPSEADRLLQDAAHHVSNQTMFVGNAFPAKAFVKARKGWGEKHSSQSEGRAVPYNLTSRRKNLGNRLLAAAKAIFRRNLPSTSCRGKRLGQTS